MKSILVISLVFLLSIGIFADTYVKTVYRYADRYHHGSLQPGYEMVYEWWIGKDKVSFISQEYRNYENYLLEPAMRITLDKQNRHVIAVNNSDSTYALVAFPGTPEEAVESSAIPVLKEIKLTGTIQKTGEKASLDGLNCENYLVKETIAYGDYIFYERERVLKVAADVAFDWKLTAELAAWLRSFSSPDPQYSAGMEKISGFFYAANDMRYLRGNKLESMLKTVEISRKEPPANVYGIPGELKKIDRLTQDYLSAFRRMIYNSGG